MLYEGYLLYPYRRSSGKNRVRWQFGVLAPRAWVGARGPVRETVAGSVDAWRQRTECLLEARPSARLEVRLRFLQLQHRSVRRRGADGELVEVDELEVGGERHLTFDEAVPKEFDLAVELSELAEREHTELIPVAGGEETEPLGDVAGDRRARVVRTRWPLSARVHLSISDAPAPFPLRRLRVDIENAVTDQAADAPRAEVLRRCLVATHCLLGVRDGVFLSLLDPPAWASAAAKECVNLHTFPVLAGEGGGRDAVLSSPIILYDHPRVAPESPGDLFDASEIDEILSLRTLTLTDEEKREARATDPRAKAIMDRVDLMPKEMFARLHGAVRSLHRVADGAVSEPPPLPRPAPGGGTRARTVPCRPAPTPLSWTGSASRGAAGSGCRRGARAPMPTTCSSRAGPRASRPSCWMSTTSGTWRWCWRTIRARTCTSGTGGTTTSPRRTDPARDRGGAGHERSKG